MAGLDFAAGTPAVALTAATARTALQIIGATNHKALLKGMKVAFDGASPTAVPVAYRILKQTTAGTMTALTLRKMTTETETLQTTAAHSATGAEPTAGDVLEEGYIHPQTGQGEYMPFGEEIVVPGGGRVGFEFTAPAAVNVKVSVRGEE